jgi:hypothetical protein
MRAFKSIRCGAISNDGVFVDPHFTHDLSLYELFDGEKFLIMHEVCGSGHFFGRLVCFRFEEVDEPPNLRTALPDELRDQIQRDLAKAYAAMGIGCIMR